VRPWPFHGNDWDTSGSTNSDGRAIALVDDLLVGYAEWRDGCDAVADAYERWSTAPRSESDLRFAAFRAALDQEQTAASAYAEAIGNLERFLPTTTRA
jgi:hypothetical protein